MRYPIRYINGCREEMGWLEGGGAIIVIGGWLGKDPVLERCVLTHPRGWSCCHLVDGSQGGRICNNGQLTPPALSTIVLMLPYGSQRLARLDSLHRKDLGQMGCLSHAKTA